jgi:DNA-binding GntR family transcriptional regulator
MNEMKKKTSVYQLLKKEIVLGKRKPGEVFGEKEFAQQMKISRTPVHEAVMQLSQEGYMRIMPQRGTVVSNISLDEIYKLYEARMILEPSLIRIAAEKIDEEHRKELLQWKKDFKKIISEKAEKWQNDLKVEGAEDFYDMDAKFHLFLATCSGNEILNEYVDQLMMKTQRIRCLSNTESRDRYLASLKEHLNIIEAVEKKDAEKASEAMMIHLKNSEEGYTALLMKDASKISVF